MVSILALGGVVFAATNAWFSDTETSSGNRFVAGAFDLKIDNESYYNGNKCTEVEPDVWQWVGSADYPTPKTPCTTSWKLSDLPGKLFFNFTDLKPDDEGEDTISLHVENDAWMCMDLTLTSDDDVSSTEPELLVDKAEDPNDSWDGELGGLIQMIWWADDGDNVLEEGEKYLLNNNNPLSIKSLFGNDKKLSFALADSTGNAWGNTGPLKGNTNHYIAKGWCFGTMTVSPVSPTGNYAPNGPQGPGFSCNGTALGNESQTDNVTIDVQFSAVQARHNPNFKCKEDETPCSNEVDVMLVLDRSSSINEEELATLKNAAIAFVNALNPSTNGAHVGLASFGTVGTLNQPLTDNGAAVIAAINAITIPSGQFTNLEQGISLANTELTGANGRPGAPNIMVIITDGAPTASTGNPIGPVSDPPTIHSIAASTAATNAKNSGTAIYAVGVGTNTTTAAYLQVSIVSGLGYYFDAANFAELEEILKGLIDCSTNKKIPVPAILFSENFGSGQTTSTFPAPWEKHEEETKMQNPSGSGENTASPDGGRFALIAEDGSDADSIDGWICREVNATGFNTLSLLYYWRGDQNAEPADTGLVQYKIGGACSDATGWTDLATHVLSPFSPWAGNAISLPGALNGTSFFIRFYNNSSADNENFRVDGISLVGIPN